MTSLHSAEIEWIVVLQHAADLRRLFSYANSLGYGSIPYVVGLVYLCVSRPWGLRLHLLTALNGCMISILKTAFHLPRPYQLDPRIQAMDSTGSYGMPSGHVQGAAGTWFMLASALRNRWAWFIAGLLVFAVALSRVYFGVHFISDTVGGLVAGAGMVALLLWVDRRFGTQVRTFSGWQQFGLVGLATGAVVVLGFAAAWACPPAEGAAVPPPFSTMFRALKQSIRYAGGFFATSCAVVTAGRWVRFEVTGPLWERGGRLVFAVAGLKLITYGFAWLPVPGEKVLQLFLTVARAASTPFWLMVIAPLILMGAEWLPKARPQGPTRPGPSTEESVA
jgi:membrane-associated phospholipid phosphatase